MASHAMTTFGLKRLGIRLIDVCKLGWKLVAVGAHDHDYEK